MKKKILIIEDDRDINELLAELLQDNGFDAISTFNGLEAIQALQSETHPNLILLDLMMPTMDGFTFRKEQLANPKLKAIPVIVMSADDRMTHSKEEIPAEAYIKKPLDIDDLLKTIHDLIQ